MIRSSPVAMVLAALLLAGTMVQAAERRALLIGVSDYDETVRDLAPRLEGPPNDVALMATTLLEAGMDAAELTLMTDGEIGPDERGIGQPIRPTRSAVLSALDRLADGAAAGDQILVYLSGHGAQTVSSAGDHDEPDGLDEIFLPSDFVKTGEGYENAILDDEIGLRIDRMMAAGASVWLIADTCHSGSLRRSADPGAVPRLARLDPVPVGAGAVREEPPLGAASPARQRSGEFVGFYAAEAGALAYEERREGSVHGLLTWSIVRAMRRGTARSYADLAREATSLLWQEAAGRAAPRFIGALERPHIAAPGETTSEDRRFAVSFDATPKIAGGRIDGLSPGTVIAVGNPDGVPLFEASITSANLTEANFALPASPAPDLDAAIAAEGLDPDRFRNRWLQDRASTLAAWVLDRPVAFDLTLGLPSDADLSPALEEAIREMVADLEPRVRIGETDADVSLVRVGDRLALRAADATTEAILSAPATPEGIARLEPLLARVARVTALTRAALSLTDTPLATALTADLQVSEGERLATGDCPRWPRETVPAPKSERWPRQVDDCDLVEISVENRGTETVDVTPLYIAPDHRVYFLGGYARSHLGGLRLSPGEHGSVRYIETTETPDGVPLATGPMSVLLLAVKADLTAPPRDFRYLQEDTLPPQRRSGPGAGLDALLEAAGYGSRLRSGPTSDLRLEAGAALIPLRTVAGEVHARE